jgi:hypothetical protein
MWLRTANASAAVISALGVCDASGLRRLNSLAATKRQSRFCSSAAMPVWSKIVYTQRVRLKMAAARWRLRRGDHAHAQQETALANLTRQLSATSVWKKAGLEAGMRYADFRSRVPLHRYDDLAPALERMQRGEADVLAPGRCTLFGLTSGTTSGKPRCLPMTPALLEHFRAAGLESLLYYAIRARSSAAFQGRHLFLGGTTALTPVSNENSAAAFVGDASGIVARNFPAWAARHFYEPGQTIAEITPWDAQVDAIAERTRSCDITLIAGLPNCVTQFSRVLRTKFGHSGRRAASLQMQWPNLRCLAHSGTSIAPYAVELRRTLGPTITFHEIYAAAECVIAAQDGEPGQGLRVLADKDIFFEFLTLSEFDDARLEHLGPKAVPIAEVKTGIDYVLLVTTPGGLVRYVLGDVVRFTSVTPPRLIHVGGTQLRLNAFGENVSEKDATDALASLCQRRDWTLVNFHVAPLFTRNERTGHQRGSHEWWVELKPGTTATPTGPQMATELDAELQRTNPTYRAKRAAGTVESPTGRLVMPGVFEHWLRFHQKWGGQHKMPRCRSDRIVADELAHVTNFARD